MLDRRRGLVSGEFREAYALLNSGTADATAKPDPQAGFELTQRVVLDLMDVGPSIEAVFRAIRRDNGRPSLREIRHDPR